MGAGVYYLKAEITMKKLGIIGALTIAAVGVGIGLSDPDDILLYDPEMPVIELEFEDTLSEFRVMVCTIESAPRVLTDKKQAPAPEGCTVALAIGDPIVTTLSQLCAPCKIRLRNWGDCPMCSGTVGGCTEVCGE